MHKHESQFNIIFLHSSASVPYEKKIDENILLDFHTFSATIMGKSFKIVPFSPRIVRRTTVLSIKVNLVCFDHEHTLNVRQFFRDSPTMYHTLCTILDNIVQRYDTSFFNIKCQYYFFLSTFAGWELISHNHNQLLMVWLLVKGKACSLCKIGLC